MLDIVSTTIAQAIVTAAGSLVTLAVPIILAKLNKISELHTAVFGVDDIEEISGLVGIVERQQATIERNQDKIEEVKESQGELLTRVKRLEDHMES